MKWENTNTHRKYKIGHTFRHTGMGRDKEHTQRKKHNHRIPHTHKHTYIHKHTNPQKVRHTSTKTVPHTGMERYKKGKTNT